MRSKHGLLQQDLELTAQQLLAPLGVTRVLEIDNVEAVPTIEPVAAAPASAAALEDTAAFEIELTAEQMNALLEGRAS